jgi:hypothetical protein
MEVIRGRERGCRQEIRGAVECGRIRPQWRGQSVHDLSPVPDRRIADKQTLTSEIAAWKINRNANHAKADFQFTTETARIS